ncbi:MAG: dienelactone hydrolase family protein [Flavobacterium sp.]|nr:dienelactone hydrolase family protein [Pedobacter sp.]
MYRHAKQIIESGTSFAEAKNALILLHGRGATAESIMNLANQFDLKETVVFSPQATNNSWYPFSFMAPVDQNQPALNSALEIIAELVQNIVENDIAAERIFFAGFSQGACLALEYVTRNAQIYGGVIAYTGGLIGENLNFSNYHGDFNCSPILITTGDPDPHVPLLRVKETVTLLEKMNAKVTLKIYKGRNHTIQMEEIDLANQLIFK